MLCALLLSDRWQYSSELAEATRAPHARAPVAATSEAASSKASTSSKAASAEIAATEAASSIAFASSPSSSEAFASAFAFAAAATLATKSWHARAATCDVYIDGIRLAASLILANIVRHLVAVAWVPRHHFISMEEEATAIVMVDEAIAFLVVEELDRSRCRAIAIAATTATETTATETTTAEASSLAFATALAFAKSAWPASATTDDLDIDCVRLAASGVLANVENHLVAIARVPRHHVVTMEEKAASVVLVDEAEAFRVVEKLDCRSVRHAALAEAEKNLQT